MQAALRYFQAPAATFAGFFPTRKRERVPRRRGGAPGLAWWLPGCLALALLGGQLPAAEVLPPAPKQYFNDYAGVVSPTVAAQLNQTLENFERQTSDQILVVIYPTMQSDSSIEDYTVRLAQSWKVGQKGRDNGAVLFVFAQDHKLFLQVGYGLEGALPDALAKRIIETEIKPRFRAGDYAGGLSSGVSAILAAVKGEYRGTGTTVAQGGRNVRAAPALLLLVIFGGIGLLVLIRVLRGLTGMGYRRSGYGFGSGWTMGGGGWGGGGGGGGGWSGGGGGFSGGGGGFGGGGAGGSW